MPNQLPKFTKKLIIWYLDNKRSLPWRESQNPYTVWLSEIILQQTRVQQGLPYYQKFVSAFPTINDLAEASEEQVMKLWQGLGYYSRARNLHAAAKTIVSDFNGHFPQSYDELKSLKGVGDYTASAIGSICFDLPTAVVDGNVYRVLSRVFGIDIPINSTSGVKTFKNLAQELLDPTQPGTYNQAIMEFGARYCVPSAPDCPNCIFADFCKAYANDSVARLPVKKKAAAVRHRYFDYLVIHGPNQTSYIEQRTGNGIWQNLYQFPLMEHAGHASKSDILKHEVYQKWSKALASDHIYRYHETPVLHKLSHQHLHIQFWIMETPTYHERLIPIATILERPVPIVLANFISEIPVFQL